ncbi:putative BTB/POZ domain-containing protein [Helianthus annuus]|nr:putative BTB/POZ domain-containing protein [Helianthus annuus]
MSDEPKPATDTISHVLRLVLHSNEEKGRQEMKSIVLKLLKGDNNNSNPNTSSLTSVDLCNDTIYSLCRTCLGSLLVLFRQLAQPEVTQQVVKQMVLEADNMLWLLDILADRQAADEYALMWANQQELTGLHLRVSIVNRHYISCITAGYLLVVDEGIGRTVLTFPLEDQQIIMLGWLSSFLKAGDNCPNLQKAFEVRWRRTFVRPHNEQSNSQSLD